MKMQKTLLGVVMGASMILVALIARYAHNHGWIDGDMTLRVVAMNGLVVAWMGNAMPKSFVPYAWARQSRRFTGWMLVLSGLAYTGLWLFAPLPVAFLYGTMAIFGGVIVSMGYCFWLRSQTRAAV